MEKLHWPFLCSLAINMPEEMDSDESYRCLMLLMSRLWLAAMVKDEVRKPVWQRPG